MKKFLSLTMAVLMMVASMASVPAAGELTPIDNIAGTSLVMNTFDDMSNSNFIIDLAEDSETGEIIGVVEKDTTKSDNCLKIENANFGIDLNVTGFSAVGSKYPYIKTKFMLPYLSGDVQDVYNIAGMFSRGFSPVMDLEIYGDGQIGTTGIDRMPKGTFKEGKWYTYEKWLDFSELDGTGSADTVYMGFSLKDEDGNIVYSSSRFATETSGWNPRANTYTMWFNSKVDTFPMYVDDIEVGYYTNEPTGYFIEKDSGGKYMSYIDNGGNPGAFAFYLSTTQKLGTNYELDKTGNGYADRDWRDYEFEMDFKLNSHAYPAFGIAPFAMAGSSYYSRDRANAASPVIIVNGKAQFQSVIDIDSSGNGNDIRHGYNDGSALHILPDTAEKKNEFEINSTDWYNISMKYTTPASQQFVRYQTGEPYVDTHIYNRNGTQNLYTQKASNAVVGEPAGNAEYYLADRTAKGRYEVVITNKTTGEQFKSIDFAPNGIEFDSLYDPYNSHVNNNGVIALALFSSCKSSSEYSIDNLLVKKINGEYTETIINTDFEDYEAGTTLLDVVKAEKEAIYGTGCAVVDKKSDATSALAEEHNIETIFGRDNVAQVPATQTFFVNTGNTLAAGAADKTSVVIKNSLGEQVSEKYEVTQAADGTYFTISFNPESPLNLSETYTLTLDDTKLIDANSGIALVSSAPYTFTVADTAEVDPTIVVTNGNSFTDNADNTVTVQPTLQSTAVSSGLDYIVILAVYNSDETELLDVAVSQGNLSAGTSISPEVTTTQTVAPGSVVKLMVWDSFSGMQNYSEVFTK